MKSQGSSRQRRRRAKSKKPDKNTFTVSHVTHSECREGKRGYETKEQAKRAIKLARGKDHLVLKRAYRCVWCDLWHLTSMSITEYEERIGR